MGFGKKIQWVDGAVPSKFNCQQARKKRLCDIADCSREVFIERQRMDVLKEIIEESCLRGKIIPETYVQRGDNMMPTFNELLPEESSKIQNSDTNTNFTVTIEKSLQVNRNTILKNEKMNRICCLRFSKNKI